MLGAVWAHLDSGEHVHITTLAERPQLAGAAFDAGEWPEFMRHNRVAEAFFWRTTEVFADICLVATSADGTAVADAHAVRFAAGTAGRVQQPPGGWEQVVVWAFDDTHRGVVADTAGALNISVAATWQRRGLAGVMLRALRDAVRRSGVDTLVAPVRPPAKAREPGSGMATYATEMRDDGLPRDPWLRTHARAGGQFVGVAPASWLVAGSLAQWRAWTAMPFDCDGAIEVPGALVPVHCDIGADHAVYVEPNVWFRHDL